MDHFNQEDFIDFQRRQPPGNPPPPPFPGGSRPGFGPGSGSPGPGPEGPPMNAPRSAPPNYTPSRGIAARVNASAIRNCQGRFTYVWLNNGEEFWMFPIQVRGNTVTGFRWTRFFRWNFFGVTLNRIDAFMCV